MVPEACFPIGSSCTNTPFTGEDPKARGWVRDLPELRVAQQRLHPEAPPRWFPWDEGLPQEGPAPCGRARPPSQELFRAHHVALTLWESTSWAQKWASLPRGPAGTHVVLGLQSPHQRSTLIGPHRPLTEEVPTVRALGGCCQSQPVHIKSPL